MTVCAVNPSGICFCGCGRVTPLAKATDLAAGRVKGQHTRFVGPGCATRYRTGFKTIEERFWSKVVKSPDCWLWTGRLSDDGYALFNIEHETRVRGHRFAYELLHGPVLDGLSLDHLCHTNDPHCPGGRTCPHRACVNPDHLEPVTPVENVRRSRTAPTAVNGRKTTCLHGHPLDGDNLYVAPTGKRGCRTCMRARKAKYRRRAKANRRAS